MEQPFRFTDVRTTQFAWTAIFATAVGWALDAVTDPLWVHLGMRASALEYLGHGLAWFGYGVLWLLLPVSAFRPENRFYTRGDCSLRAKCFAFIFGLLVILHLCIFAAVAFMFPRYG